MRNRGKSAYVKGDSYVGKLDKAILPADSVFGGRHRIQETYSDYKYYLHTYQTRSTPKKLYKRLKYAERGEFKYDADNKPTYATWTDKHTVSFGPEIEPIESFLSPFYNIVRTWRQFIRELGGAIFFEYFYSASAIYLFLWSYFYFVEYVVVCLQLYFPIINWLFYNPIFIWPISSDFYFSRFFFIFYFPSLIVFFLSQYANRIRAPTPYTDSDNSHFFVIILCSYFFSIVFSFYFLGLSVIFNSLFFFSLFSIFLLFFLYRPFGLLTDRSEMGNPVLFLPKPTKESRLFLPKYRYFYPNFFVGLSQAGFSISKRKNFTKFPFTIGTLARTSQFYKKLTVIRKTSLGFLSKERPLGSYGGLIYPKFPNAYSFDPEAFFFYLYIPKLGSHETFIEDEEFYVTRYIDAPFGMSTNHYAAVMASRAREYTNSIFDYIPTSESQNPNQLNYLRNWLGYISPSEKVIPASTQSRLFTLRDSYKSSKKFHHIEFSRFPILARFVSSYDYILMFLDFFTGYKYYSYDESKLLSNKALLNQLWVYNYIFANCLFIHKNFVLSYTSFLFYFFDKFDWQLENDSPTLISTYSQICNLLDSNYKLITVSNAASSLKNVDFVFIYFVLFYQMSGGNYE